MGTIKKMGPGTSYQSPFISKHVQKDPLLRDVPPDYFEIQIQSGLRIIQKIEFDNLCKTYHDLPYLLERAPMLERGPSSN